MADVLNARENRAGARAAVGHEGANVIANTLITDPTEARIVGRATERMRENDWRKSLETIGKDEPEDMHWGSWQDTLPGQVYTEINAAGQRVERPGSNETARLNTITGRMRAYETVLSDRYAALPAGPARAGIERIVAQTIRATPQLREIYLNAAGTDIDETRIPLLLNDSTLKKHLADSLNEIYDPAKRFNMVDIQKADEALRKVVAERAQLALEQTAATGRAGANTRTNFDNSPNTGPYGGNSGTAMQGLEGSLQIANLNAIIPPNANQRQLTEIAQRQQDIQQFAANLEQRAQLAAMDRTSSRDRAIATLDQQLQNARADATPVPNTNPPRTYGQYALNYQTLFERRAEVDKIRTEAQAKVAELTTKMAEKDAEINQARVAQQDKLREATAASAKFERQVDRALAKAAKNTIGEKIATYLDGYRPAEAESLELAKEENKQRISEEVQRRLTRTRRRWINYLPGTGWLGNNHREVLNEGQIRRDARVLLRQGPEALVRQVLAAVRMPDGTRGIPDGEMEMLLRDPAFMDTQGKEIYGKVLAGHIMTGGKIAPSQYDALAMTDWGPQVMTEMLSRNEQVREMVSQYTGQPFTESSIRELMADPQWRKKWLRRALLVAGGAALLAGPGVTSAVVGGAANAAGWVGTNVLHIPQWTHEAQNLANAAVHVAANQTGPVIAGGIDATVKVAGDIGNSVAANVAAVGQSNAIQDAGKAVSGALGTADTALRAGTVGTEIGEAAKYAKDTATTTADVIVKNAAAAKAAFIKP